MREALGAGLWAAFFLNLSATAEPAAPAAPVELVETFPVETSMDHPELPEAHEVWLAMIQNATRRIDLAHFYASNHPGSRLETVIQALEAAATRGVRVRFLSEASFAKTYPETLDRLEAHPGIDVIRYATREKLGGSLHVKMMLVDDEAFLGSQNFDWRALEHIQELGVRVRLKPVVDRLGAIFELDWRLASGETVEPQPPRPGPAIEVGDTSLRVVASAKEFLPDGVDWDLPHLVRIMDGATTTLRVQLLSYDTVSRDGTYFADLDNALRRAAARGVQVELLLADWCKRSGTIDRLKSLQVFPGIEVRLVTIPEWSGGFLPFSRVIHAKFLAVDGQRFWIGTSNWSRSYFHGGRNIGLVIEDSALTAQVEAFFQTGWSSEHAYPVDPSADYVAPRRSR